MNKPSYEVFVGNCKDIILNNSDLLSNGKWRIKASDLYNLYNEFCIESGYENKRKLQRNKFYKFIENSPEFITVKMHNALCYDLDMTYFEKSTTSPEKDEEVVEK